MSESETDIWKTAFSQDQRDSQEEEDRAAWRSIAIVLMGIIVMGLMLSFLTIYLVVNF